MSQIATPGVALTVCGAVMASLSLFCLFSWKKGRSGGPVRPQVASAAATPAQAEKEIRGTQTPVNHDGVRPGTSVAKATPDNERQRPTANDSASPSATPISGSLSDPTVVVSANQAREIKPSETERKNIERERREAERKRSRLESMYRRHQISDEAYKKGQDEYKNEMAKYRSTLNGTGSANE